MEIPFSKLHENGADFLIIDEYHRLVIPEEMKSPFAEGYCDRRFGIGGEGVIFMMKSAKDDLRMRLFLPDGREAEMCGDGIRCMAKCAFDAGYINGSCTVETPAGSIGVAIGTMGESFSATIIMAPPRFERKDIPATGEGEYRERIGEFDVYAANTGVPHAVIRVEDLDAPDVVKKAPDIRHHITFLKGADVNFVEKIGEDSIRIRTFRQGVKDETLSSGTGATASAAVMHRLGLTGDIVAVETRGGPLTISLKGVTKLEGPAETVFTGVIPF